MARPYKVSVITTSRADFGIYTSVLEHLSLIDDIDLGLIVSGMHLPASFGNTLKVIEKSKYQIHSKFECLMASDTPEAIAKSMGLGTLAAGQALIDIRPDLVVALGDRFEMHAIALAALPFGIPIAHIHGGEETEGAIDNALRHSLSKLSHLHFCSTEMSARRILQMGEHPDLVYVSGAPALDQLETIPRLTREQLDQQFGIPPMEDFLLVTFHPETLNINKSTETLEILLELLSNQQIPSVFTLSNADTHGGYFNQKIKEYVFRNKTKSILVESFGQAGYFSAMSHAKAMIGNSSSGIIEAASFNLPVVNIGDRQKGRERSANTIDCAPNAPAIKAALDKALSLPFKEIASSTPNIYSQGNAGQIISQKIHQALKKGLNAQKAFNLNER